MIHGGQNFCPHPIQTETSMNKDLTTGKPSLVLWQFCLPLFGSIIFQQLYNIADSLVAGRYIGENALAAVGNSYEITLIFIAFGFGSNIGCSVVVSQLFGAKRIGRMKTAVHTAMVASGVLCAVLMACGLLLGGTLLQAIDTPQTIFADSKLYLDIYILGLPFVFFYNISTGVFSALGDSKTPFLFLAASSLSNIFVDILFVSVFNMGVAGVAWATFLCQGVSCVLAMTAVFRRLHGMETSEQSSWFSFDIFKHISSIAVPSILQQSFISVGNILIQGVINGFGPGVIAGYAAAIKLNNLVITSLSTLGTGITSFTAQNFGANMLHRVRAGFRAGLKMVLMLSLPLTALYLLFSRPMIGFFMNHPSEQAMQTGIVLLSIVAPFYPMIASKFAADGVLRGAGWMRPFMIITFSDLIVRVVLAFVLAQTSLGSTGIWWAWPIGWAVATVLAIYFYRKGPWYMVDVTEAES